MKWTIIYHRDVEDDLESISPTVARRIMGAINTKLTKAPGQFGAPLSGNLATFRKLRIGEYRVVYQVVEAMVTVYVLAVGPRRDKEIYKAATRRIK